MKMICIVGMLLSFLGLSAVPCGAPVPSRVAAQTTVNTDGAIVYPDGAVDWQDANIKYIGRWAEKDTYIQGYWEGYFEVRFTGTSVKVKLRTGCNLAVSLDGGELTEYRPARTTMSFSDLENTVHTLRVVSLAQSTFPKFKGLILDKGASTLPPAEKPLVEFVGDSITEGYIGSATDGTQGNAGIYSFAYQAGDLLEANHNQIAFGGITMADGYGNLPEKIGMVTRYFQLSEPAAGDVAAWDTTRYTPDAIVINMGTNDPPSSPDFYASYLSFLQKLREAYPDTMLFAMRPFNGSHALNIQRAVKERTDAGDMQVYYMDTTDWATDTTDGLHPTKAVNTAAAAKLADFLKPYLYPEAITPSSASPSAAAPSPAGIHAENPENASNTLLIGISGGMAVLGILIALLFVRKRRNLPSKK